MNQDLTLLTEGVRKSNLSCSDFWGLEGTGSGLPCFKGGRDRKKGF